MTFKKIIFEVFSSFVATNTQTTKQAANPAPIIHHLKSVAATGANAGANNVGKILWRKVCG